MKAGGEKKMTLKEYAIFKNSMAFTISYLNQVSQSIDSSPTPQISQGEAVDALDLLDLSRSTLKQTGISSSSSASLTLDQVITDIEALKWQDCCLTSLQIISSDQVTRSVTKPKQKSNKRKKTMTLKKKKPKSIRSVNELVFD